MKPYQASSILAVRDSLEEEFSDDVEDDVFIRDGKSSKVCHYHKINLPKTILDFSFHLYVHNLLN